MYILLLFYGGTAKADKYSFIFDQCALLFVVGVVLVLSKSLQ